jgi:phosphate starvation-inducible protein PhoH
VVRHKIVADIVAAYERRDVEREQQRSDASDA